MAGIASEENAWSLIMIVERIHQTMTNLVDRMPRYFLNINGVRRINLICLAHDGVNGGLADLTIVICRNLAQVNIHA